MSNSKIEKVNLYSNVLQKDMSFSIYLPCAYDNVSRLPVLYFLHGRSGDENIIFELDIFDTVNKLIQNEKIKPLIIVCPRMENSRGLNSSSITQEIVSTDLNGQTIHLGRYEDYFMKEIIPFIDCAYKTIGNKEGRYIGGVSAGGYAALNYGLRFSDMFSKVGGHMPALELQLDREDIPYFNTIDIWNKYNPLSIAENNDAINSDLHVYLDAGNNDEGGFYNGCLELYNILKERGINVQNHIFEGHHNIAYVKSNFEKYLIFYAANN